MVFLKKLCLGDFLHHVKVFPEGCSCPFALFLLLLLLPPPPPSFCTVHSDDMDVHPLWKYWYSTSLELYLVVHVSVGKG